MNTVIIKLLIFVSGYTMPSLEIQTGLEQLPIKPVIEKLDYTRPILGFQTTYFTNLVACYFEKKKKCVFVLPPLTNGAALFAAGVAIIGSQFASTFYMPNFDRFNRIALLHEIGHSLGAKHDDSNCNIMHSNAMGCLSELIKSGFGETLVFNETAIRQVKRTQKKKKSARRF